MICTSALTDSPYTCHTTLDRVYDSSAMCLAHLKTPEWLLAFANLVPPGSLQKYTDVAQSGDDTGTISVYLWIEANELFCRASTKLVQILFRLTC